ncbi:MAG TPA: VOC family protein [Candidatus Acidoferrales bacterium]|nr:VOC family protein [Candidatus Acidoferrales bacterium]
MRKISTCLWFDRQAQEAAEFYTSLIPNSHIDHIERAPRDYPDGREGDVLTVDFTLDGTTIVGLNGGPAFHFDEAISLMIECDDQAEVDRYWDALTRDGGEPSQCGWLKDRYGLSWQIVPKRMNELFRSPDREAAGRAFDAMMTMQKIDIAKIEAAYAGREPVGARR